MRWNILETILRGFVITRCTFKRMTTFVLPSYKAQALGCLILTPLFFQTMQMIDDDNVVHLRSMLNKEINSMKAEYGQTTTYPEIKYETRGATYTVSFTIDQRKCDLLSVLNSFISTYSDGKGFKVTNMKSVETNGVMTLDITFEENDPEFKTPQTGKINITVDTKAKDWPAAKFYFEKNHTLTKRTEEGLVKAYRQAIKPKEFSQSYPPSTSSQPFKQTNTKPTPSKGSGKEAIKKLMDMGLTVFDSSNKSINLDWDCLAGYERQKRMIEDTVLLALSYPEIYDEITEQTRVKYEANRPKAVLFEGPPGTGKTTSAKIIAQQVQIPLIYMPIEAIMSKFYGESEQKLADMWELCRSLGKVIIFIDEIDALAGSRDSDMHEASRRILSTLLRKIDSFESTTDVLLICATNRKKDLDPAMLSRIDLSVPFNLPDKQSRAAIFQRYAKHLSQDDLAFLAQETSEFSGRNISDICKRIPPLIIDAERRWASKLIRKETTEKLPNLSEYLAALLERKENNLA